MSNLESVHEMFEDYWKSVCEAGNVARDSIQFIETRRAFYAGIFAAICQMRVVGTDAVTEDQGVAYFESVYRECVAFYEKVKANKA